LRDIAATLRIEERELDSADRTSADAISNLHPRAAEAAHRLPNVVFAASAALAACAVIVAENGVASASARVARELFGSGPER